MVLYLSQVCTRFCMSIPAWGYRLFVKVKAFPGLSSQVRFVRRTKVMHTAQQGPISGAELRCSVLTATEELRSLL